MSIVGMLRSSWKISRMCRFAISRWSTYATPPNTASAAMGPIQRQIRDGSCSVATFAGGGELMGWRCWIGPCASTREGLVLDAVRLVGVFAFATLVVLGVFLIVAFAPDHFRIAFEREDVGGDAIEEPAIVRDHHRAAGEVEQRVLERAQRVDVEVVGRLVEEQQVAA